jgi:hypothetical protein
LSLCINYNDEEIYGKDLVGEVFYRRHVLPLIAAFVLILTTSIGCADRSEVLPPVISPIPADLPPDPAQARIGRRSCQPQPWCRWRY